MIMDFETETNHKRVVVVIGAVRDDSLKAIRGFLENFSLKSGDTITVLVVLHKVNNPMGYSVSVDSDSMFGTNEKIVEGARKNKELEYNTNKEILAISKNCEAKKIGFHVMVRAGKTEAVEEARLSRATWVVLDKEMKRDKKIFLDGLSCGIARIKRHSSLEILRPPKEIVRTKPFSRDGTKPHTDNSARGDVLYDEMIPGSPKGKHSHYKKSREQGVDASEESPHNSTKKRGSIPVFSKKTASPTFNQEESSGGFETDEQLLSICSECKNRRPKSGWKKEFTYAELHAATSGFSDTKFLSEGGFGSVYRGELRNGLEIAVKQHKNASHQGEREFKAEVHFLSRARHENVVMLLGSCSEGTNRLLVYEYVCNGSLDRHLTKHKHKPLSWDERMKIATGAAKGLQYLHKKNIVHRDIRPNNILLTHDYHTMLGDFGLARTQREDHSSETQVVGALGYLAPEYAESGKVSTKTDVYAFGVILLQLITGRSTNDKSLAGKSLVGWARPLLKDKNYPDLIDPRIVDSHDFHQLFWMVRVAEKCLIKNPYKRITMDTIVYTLKYLEESDAICSIKLSPVHSDSSPRSPLDTPEDKVVYEDHNDHEINYVKKLSSKTGYHQSVGRILHSSSSDSISSGSSSLWDSGTD